jgi:hypothetical protein
VSAGTTVGHNSGRSRASDRQQPRKSKRADAAHTDRYADKSWTNQLAGLAEHFMSEERADERR